MIHTVINKIFKKKLFLIFLILSKLNSNIRNRQREGFSSLTTKIINLAFYIICRFSRLKKLLIASLFFPCFKISFLQFQTQ